MVQQFEFKPGEIIQVFQKITEGDKTRTQMFEGVLLSLRGRGDNKSFTVRKTVGDIAVERIWQLNSPNIEDIKMKSKPKRKIRRAKLYYLRDLK